MIVRYYTDILLHVRGLFPFIRCYCLLKWYGQRALQPHDISREISSYVNDVGAIQNWLNCTLTCSVAMLVL